MEYIPASQNERMRLLTVLLRTVGYELERSESPLDRIWGEHLLEDWKSLALLTQKEHDAA